MPALQDMWNSNVLDSRFCISVVSVGYEYSGCEKIFWDKQATTLSGFLGGDLSSSDRSVAKGWSLDIQHFYNYHEGEYPLVLDIHTIG